MTGYETFAKEVEWLVTGRLAYVSIRTKSCSTDNLHEQSRMSKLREQSTSAPRRRAGAETSNASGNCRQGMAAQIEDPITLPGGRVHTAQPRIEVMRQDEEATRLTIDMRREHGRARCQR